MTNINFNAFPSWEDKDGAPGTVYGKDEQLMCTEVEWKWTNESQDIIGEGAPLIRCCIDIWGGNEIGVEGRGVEGRDRFLFHSFVHHHVNPFAGHCSRTWHLFGNRLRKSVRCSAFLLCCLTTDEFTQPSLSIFLCLWTRSTWSLQPSSRPDSSSSMNSRGAATRNKQSFSGCLLGK